MEFKASYDTLSKVLTIGVIVLFIFIGKKNLEAISENYINYGVVFFPASLLVGLYLFSTKKYVIESDQLVIERPIGKKKISINDIKEVRLIKAAELMGMIRLFGNGGFCGYYGIYYSKALGSVKLYTTKRKNRIFIRTGSGSKIIISPDDLGLMNELKSKLATF